MKQLDSFSKIVLSVLVLFIGWVGYQVSTSSPSSSKKSKKALVEKQVEMPKAVVFEPYVGRYLSKPSDSLFKFDATEPATIKIEKTSWTSFDFAPNGHLYALGLSEFTSTESMLSLKSGLFYINNVTNSTAITANSIPLRFKGTIAVVIEKNKVRIFGLNTAVEYDVFGKTQRTEMGKGSSLFLDQKRVTTYDLGAAVSVQKTDSKTISWTTKNQTNRFIVFSSKVDTVDNFLVTKRNVEFLKSNLKSHTLLDGFSFDAIFTENQYGTWSAN